MTAIAFDLDAPLGHRRVIIRRDGDGVEMVELPWGLNPSPPGGRPFALVRSERHFPSHRCLIPASEFRFGRAKHRYTVSLRSQDWFYLAGIWRPASEGWPEAFAILTVEANADIAPYQERQMAVLRREHRMHWLDLRPEHDLLRPLPAGSFAVSLLGEKARQAALAI
ncbi:SOS response-associated peptidase family protein [Rhodoligotrophos defluvii]|uniref:SOS response-associated peptidase family protein n=1 Tax=Rhodoligotrophos defluvii TaxID=2561934 RepID=UPI0010CA1EA8|nr:SOS response-associated peptidase family protein [Rhodoligotrophos defluvii]